MKNKLLIAVLLLIKLTGSAQDTEGNFIKDTKTGCIVWFKHTFTEDSVTWSGGCKNNYADGEGTLTGFTKGKQTSKYMGNMLNGKPDGKGIFTFGDKRKLEGNFSHGEPLFLDEKYLRQLHKNIISETDSAETYVGDNNLNQLYYHALIPDGRLSGAVVLMPGTWETTEHLISSTQALCERCYENHLAVIVLSVNQRLTMTEAIVALVNKMLDDAANRYRIPKDKFVMGGFSMGGLFSLRYTEMANEYADKTAIKPAAVFSCDGPCDLENIYGNFKMKLKKFPDAGEPAYGIKELEKYCGGNPDAAKLKYIYYSCYSHSEPDGGNAKYLINTPVRIYSDVDPNWWMQNRGVDMYDMNALDQSAMILLLHDRGNKKAEFINAYGKGYRIEGNRHPHSWSIVEPGDCLHWMVQCLK